MSREFERFLMWVISYACIAATLAVAAQLRRMWRMEQEFQVLAKRRADSVSTPLRVKDGTDRLLRDIRDINNKN